MTNKVMNERTNQLIRYLEELVSMRRLVMSNEEEKGYKLAIKDLKEFPNMEEK